MWKSYCFNDIVVFRSERADWTGGHSTYKAYPRSKIWHQHFWLKSYLSHETDIWFIKLIFEPWNFNWHPIPELQILSDDWHLAFGNAFWLIWRALLVIESWLVFSLEASVSLECQFGSLTGLVPLKCIFAWLTAFFNYIWYNHTVWNFSFGSDIQYLGYEIDIWFMIF